MHMLPVCSVHVTCYLVGQEESGIELVLHDTIQVDRISSLCSVLFGLNSAFSIQALANPGIARCTGAMHNTPVEKAAFTSLLWSLICQVFPSWQCCSCGMYVEYTLSL